jgi:hypothetical protein
MPTGNWIVASNKMEITVTLKNFTFMNLNYLVTQNVALERLAHATTNKGYSPASPLQALVELSAARS